MSSLLEEEKTTLYEELLMYDGDIEEALKGENYVDVLFDLTETDEDLRLLYNEVLRRYVMEQTARQLIFGVQFEQGFRKKRWFIPYSEYRSPEYIIDNQFFTKEEKNKLYEEHSNLIYEVMHKYEPNPNSYATYTQEDIYDACVIGFTKALNNYSRKNISVKFVTYAYTSMSNCCQDVIKGSKTKGKGDTVVLSLDVNYGEEDDKKSNSESSLISKAPNEHNNDYDNLVDNNIMTDIIVKIMEGLDEDHVFVALHNYGILGSEKLTKVEIAQTLYISAPKVDRYIRDIEKHFKNKCYQLGINASDIF